MENADGKLNRREFLQKTAVVAAGSAALNPTALSYSRIAGANDRITLGHVGVGVRGGELLGMAGELKDSKNVEMVAVCDLWSVNREKAVAENQKTLWKGASCISPPGRDAGEREKWMR